jgi:hypothetical protein
MVLAGHGWPVVRGTYCDGGVWRGRPQGAGVRPVDEDWLTGWTVRVDQVAHWWSEQPYSVVVACGSWVAVPPTGHHHGTSPGYQWVSNTAPNHLGWQLPELRPVCEVITATVRAGARNGPPGGLLRHPGPRG